MIALDALPGRYRAILCDIWGCVHDGVDLYPGAAERLLAWRGEGRTIILVTNAPRTREAVAAQLDRIGLPREAYDGISTSGEAGIAALLALGTPVGFLGTPGDRAILEGRGVPLDAGPGASNIACTGLMPDLPTVEEHRFLLASARDAGATLHCLNPDRLVVRGGVPEPCAGALADLYEAMGGRVAWYGKPFPTIYAHALGLAGYPPREAVLAIGDGLQTDILGAAGMGFDCVFVQGGIGEGQDFPDDFGERAGRPGWRPVAVVPSLG